MTMEIQESNELDRHPRSSNATIIKFKGKRTRRQRPPSPLALTMACSSSSDSEARTIVPHHRLADEDSDPTTTTTSTTTTFTMSHDSPEHTKEEEEDMANCLMLLARGRGPIARKSASDHDNDKVEESCAFSCKTCGRSFSSFQALGGHRASHKKPKLDDDKNNKPLHITMKGNDSGDKQPSVAACTDLSLQIMPAATGGTSSSRNKSSNKVHECSICGAEFNSGQALGGHMRRHRAVISGSRANTTESEIKKVRHGQGLPDLDLNLPAPAVEEEREAAEYAFASREQVLVFSTSPLALVDCHY